MGRSRKARRRAERARAKRASATRRLSPATRLSLIVGGIVCVLGGVALLAAGGPGTAERLGRVAGILIIIGVVALIAAAVGHV